MGLSSFRVTGTPGELSVQVDGQDLSPLVQRVSVDCVVGEIPKVYIESNGTGAIEGEGIVHVVQDGLNPAAMIEWLQGLDPGELEKAMLDQPFDATTGQLCVQVLVGWLRGD